MRRLLGGLLAPVRGGLRVHRLRPRRFLIKGAQGTFLELGGVRGFGDRVGATYQRSHFPGGARPAQ